MARVNTANPLTHKASVRKSGLTERAHRSTPTPTEEPVTQSRHFCNSTSAHHRGSSQHKPAPGTIFDIFPDPAIESASSTASSPRKQKKTRTLKATQANSLLLPLQQRPRQRPRVKVETDDYEKENDITEEVTESFTTPMESVPQRSPTRRNRNMPRTPGGSRADHRSLTDLNTDTEEEDNCGDNSFDSLDEFIVSDNEEISYHETSDSETEDEKAPTPPPPPPQSTRKRLMTGRRPNADTGKKELNEKTPKAPFALEVKLTDAIKSHTTTKDTSKHRFQDDLHLSPKLNKLNLEDDKEPASQWETDPAPPIIELDSAPPALRTVEKSLETPPSSPSKNRPRSPTKEKIRIPPTPHRESVDAFWSQDATNDWIDQHSPRKEKFAEHSVIELLRDLDISEDEDCNSESRTSSEPDSMSHTKHKTPKTPKTPSKTALKKAEAEAKRAAKARRASFNKKKAVFAETFLRDLDNAVCGGEVCRLAQQTGGVRIAWSKTLQKTAGRAHWRAERDAIRGPDGQTMGLADVRHHASIELAERIIDDEYRLINTLTHEYCHLANYMISRVQDNPHGASFKLWGKKCAEALKDHPMYGGQIHVTTKHTYQIDWKYVWSCVSCGLTYGRHSKSINTDTQRCGGCKDRLEQVKPKPRNMSPKKCPVTPMSQKKMMADVARSLGGFTL